jgi:hypothetical protein
MLRTVRRYRLLIVVIQAILLVISTSGIYGASPQVARLGDESPGLPNSGPANFREFPISDEYAVAETRKTSGAAVASRMLHRVRATMTYPDALPLAAPLANSANWGGWIGDTTGHSHLASGAYGHFVAQTVCSSCQELAPWIGIGGYHSTNIAQGAFDEKRRQLLYELYPNNPVYIAIYPAAGDQLFVNVHLDLVTFKWYIAVDDLTKGQYWASEFSFSVSEDTADWILELPGGGTVPSSNSVLFTQSQWLDEHGNNQSGILTSEDSVVNINLVNTTCGSVIPSALSNGYQQFTDVVSGC